MSRTTKWTASAFLAVALILSAPLISTAQHGRGHGPGQGPGKASVTRDQCQTTSASCEKAKDGCQRACKGSEKCGARRPVGAPKGGCDNGGNGGSCRGNDKKGQGQGRGAQTSCEHGR